MCVEYGYDNRNYLLLEKKADAKKRGLNSPDDGDALALSFAHPVAISHLARPAAFAQGANYDPFA